MKIGKIKRTYDPAAHAITRAAGDPAPPAVQTISEDLEIPLKNIVAFVFSAAGVSAITALISVFLVQGPKTEAEVAQIHAEIQVERLNFQRYVLHTALALETPQERQAATRLFIHAGLLDATLLPVLPDTLPRVPPTAKPDQAAKPQIAQAANRGG